MDNSLLAVRDINHKSIVVEVILSKFVGNFPFCFPYYPLHFLLVCFRMVLQILYSSTCAADIPLVQEHAGCFCCDTEYRLLFLLTSIFGKELRCKKNMITTLPLRSIGNQTRIFCPSPTTLSSLWSCVTDALPGAAGARTARRGFRRDQNYEIAESTDRRARRCRGGGCEHRDTGKQRAQRHTRPDGRNAKITEIRQGHAWRAL